MELLSWNINGVQSAIGKGLIKFIKSNNYDIIFFQEFRKQQVPPEFDVLGYHYAAFPSERPGYSGVMTLSKSKPLRTIKGIGIGDFDSEGRVLTIETSEFYAVNAYFPNSRRDLSRLGYKLSFCTAIKKFLAELEKTKPVIIGGDFNIAHKDIDIARPKQNTGNAGFTPKERGCMDSFIESGYVDTFRLFDQNPGNYTWWSNMYNSREKNIGWRVDYFLVSSGLKRKVKSAGILAAIKGSDHAPVTLGIL